MFMIQNKSIKNQRNLLGLTELNYFKIFSDILVKRERAFAIFRQYSQQPFEVDGFAFL